MKIHAPALSVIREFLDDALYALVDLRLSFEVERAPTGFPRFQPLQQIVGRLDASHQVLFRLFRVGEAVDDAAVRAAIPGRVLEALQEVELLEREASGQWRTPSLLIVPAEGMNLIVSVPASYPTLTRPCLTWFDLSSFVVARALPGSLQGQRVLDICSGSGLQSLLCAARGASHVVGLELHEDAVLISRANAHLNGLDSRVEFRASNALAAVKDGETFDFVICNTPYDPMLGALEVPASVEGVGNSVLWTVLERLPAHLSPRARGILGTWRAVGHQGSTAALRRASERLEKEGFSTSAYVDRAPDTVESVLKTLQGHVDQREGGPTPRGAELVQGVRALLQGSQPPMDGFYNQLIFFRKERPDAPGGSRSERASCRERVL